jgi:ribosomal protein S6
MTETLQRNYRATFILNTRDYDQSIDTLVGTIKEAVTGLGANVGEVRNLGHVDFARTPDKRHTGDVYLQISFSAPAEVPGKVSERFRLEKTVQRVLVETM